MAWPVHEETAILFHKQAQSLAQRANAEKNGTRVHSAGVKVKVLVTQSCLTLCDPVDCNPPGSSVHGILQARILEWVAMPSSRGSSRPRDRTQVSCIAGRFFTD